MMQKILSFNLKTQQNTLWNLETLFHAVDGFLRQWLMTQPSSFCENRLDKSQWRWGKNVFLNKEIMKENKYYIHIFVRS